MCNELSAIFAYIPGTEELRMIPGDVTRHHAAMIAAHGLREGIAGQNYCRTEYVPKDGDWLDCQFKIDETNIPSWVTPEIRDRMEQMSAQFRDRLVVKGDCPTMLGGKYIVTDIRTVEWADNCVILVGPKAKLTINNVGNVVFGYVSGSVQTGDVSGSVQTGDVSGSVQTGDVSGSVKIGDVYGSGSVKIGDVYGSGSVQTGKRDKAAFVCLGGVMQSNEDKK
jgi:hypothetical protein